MQRIFLIIVGITCFMALLSFSPALQERRAARTGKELFERYCKQCHGKDGARGLFGAKNLQTSQLADEALYLTIAKGRKVMPSWEKKLDSVEMGLVVAYVKTLRQ